jgi:NACHT domain
MGWLEDPVVETRILWTHGSPGVGKSAIARMIAEMCTQAGKSVASFFFSRAAPGRDSVEKLVPTLAYQLSRSIPEIRDNLTRVLGEDPLLPSRNINMQAQNLIIKPLNEYDLMTAPGPKDRARVVILDGLDECRTEDQRNILEMLSKIGADHSQSPPFFLVFSRTESRIQAAFTKEPLQSLTSCIALGDSLTRHFNELDALYDSLFSSINHVKEVLQILALLLLCTLPSRTSVIDEFLSYIPGSTATILSGLHSVLLVASPAGDELDGKIKITDASFSNFLLDRKRSRNYFINATEGRSTITKRLLQVLLTEGIIY